MRITFKKLIEVTLRHSFYGDGETPDLRPVPTRETQMRLSQLGLVFRTREAGFAIYGEIEPGTNPPQMLRPIDDEPLAVRIALIPETSYFDNITDLPSHRPGSEVFYLSNLRDDQGGGFLFLGDHVAGARVGQPIELVAKPLYRHRLPSPQHSATVEIRDVFGQSLDSIQFELDDATATTVEVPIDLSRARTVTAGRYRLIDSHGGDRWIYYDESLRGQSVFGLIDLYTRTTELTTGGTNLVPADYRFLVSNEIIEGKTYSVQLERRSTTWRYIVFKKYTNNPVTLANLQIPGPIAFAKSTTPARATFTSNAPVPLSDQHQRLLLQHNGSTVVELPNPGATTPLRAGGTPGSFISEMYVYV